MGTDDGNEAEAGGKLSRRSACLGRLDLHVRNVRVHLRHLDLSSSCLMNADEVMTSIPSELVLADSKLLLLR